MKKTLDWDAYCTTARQMAAEGSVLLRNEENVLPLANGTRVAVFGRIQSHYYKSGTGSGGMVNVSKTYNILEGLRESGKVVLNENLVKVYEEWTKEHPIDEGEGWGNEPWCQEEMMLDEEIVCEAAKESEVALVIIGRTAGEDKDADFAPGSYCLTETEKQMLTLVRAHFDQMVVILNVGNVMDMQDIDSVKPEAILYIWQGGMIGGLAAADALTGVTPPSGHLTDTIAYEIKDYPSDSNFGDGVRNFYKEDIYVGYRYFNTFAPDRVRYPFGFGLTYTEFAWEQEECITNEDGIRVSLRVRNIGAHPGKCVLQLYANLPQGLLGKPLYTLADFRKTPLLAPMEECILTLQTSLSELASYDDGGVTGHKSAYILEAGEYHFLAGEDSVHLTPVGDISLSELHVVKQCEEAMAPVRAFKRMKPVLDSGNKLRAGYESTPLATVSLKERREKNIPDELTQTEDLGYKLSDVVEGRVSMSSFVAQMTDDDLACIVRGEGMGSSLVTPGTASAFGGVNPHLRDLGIPAVCCDDGPSGMRLDCGMKAFSIPIGTLIASSMDEELTERLFEYLGLEMTGNRVDALLGPGMNIHRHPLNGRNFEYFSEDPLIGGRIAAAQIRGLHHSGATGVLKHFAANNQEKGRRTSDAVVSERALREIYLRGFEIAVREGNADAIMTSYGAINGTWTAGNYDLNTTILRKDWGYTGIVMTDWWAEINEPGEETTSGTNFAAMVRAQNDLYMVVPDGAKNSHGDNTAKALSEGTLKRGELQRSAMSICQFASHTEAMRRLCNNATQVTILNRSSDEEEIDLNDVTYITLEDFYEEDLTKKESCKGTSYLMPMDVQKRGMYEFSITGSSKLGPLAQIPVTLFYTGIPVAVMTFNGTEGKSFTMTRPLPCPNRFAILRLYVGGNGLKLDHFRVRYVREFQKGERWF